MVSEAINVSAHPFLTVRPLTCVTLFKFSAREQLWILIEVLPEEFPVPLKPR